MKKFIIEKINKNRRKQERSGLMDKNREEKLDFALGKKMFKFTYNGGFSKLYNRSVSVNY
jgi:hypothetical protein